MSRRMYVFIAVTAAVAALASVGGWSAYRYWITGTPREPARKTALANYHKIMWAQYIYYDQYDRFPGGIASENGVGLSWRVALLPYLGEEALYKQFALTEPWDSPTNLPLVEKMPAVYVSPGKPAPPGHTFIRTTQGPGGMISFTPADQLAKKAGTHLAGGTLGRGNTISDGTSNTILFLEGGEAVPWSKPDEVTVPFTKAEDRNRPFNLPRFGGVFDNGFHVVQADGVVLFLRHDYPERQVAAMLTPHGGETFTKSEDAEAKPEMLVYKSPPPKPLQLGWKPNGW